MLLLYEIYFTGSKLPWLGNTSLFFSSSVPEITLLWYILPETLMQILEASVSQSR